MRFCLIALLAPIAAFAQAASAQDGSALYKRNCAVCHDAPTGRTPALSAVRSMRPEAILAVMESGPMRAQASALTPPERRALADYLGSSTSGPPQPSAHLCASGVMPQTGPAWNGFGAHPENTRYQDRAAAGLSVSDVPKLQVKWAFSLGPTTSVRGQPSIAGGRLFVISPAAVYALDPKTGCVFWSFNTPIPVRSALTHGIGPGGSPAVFFGDTLANFYALDAGTGALLWKAHADDHKAAFITDAPAWYEGTLYVGVSSGEEIAGAAPTYECCTFRGSVLAIDAGTGKTIWKAYTVDPPAPTGKTPAGVRKFGPSGAGIWSTPTIDTKRDVVYVATGDNYSDPPTRTSDAILALDRKTGKILWSRQMTANDAFVVSCGAPSPDTQTNCPESKGPDFDFGQPPILVSLPNGKRALVIGQKSGMAHAVDPDQQGEVLWQTRIGKGGALGGIQWGSAADNRNMYVALSDIGFHVGGNSPDGAPALALDPTAGGGVFALDLVTGKQVWRAAPPPCGDKPNCSPAQSAAVAAIPGAVFAGSVDGHLRGYATSDGKVIWDFDTAREYSAVNGGTAKGGSLDGGGPAVAGGMIFTYSGYGQWGGIPGNVLLAFSVGGK
ncbi:MAG TPA: PQQ-binding-like beta-propeller repeat protein [Bryobacteraceae bacterium]|nr:PQQ-binding-like beta-propeller repeat protein [Bryobacteraceae bacterium]